MVTRFGMSRNLGPLAYGEDDQETFAGQPVSRRQHVSDLTQMRVDEEVKGIIAEGYQTAHGILTERLDELHAAAAGLREYETLSGEQLRRLLAGQPVDEAPVDEAPVDEPQEPAPAAAAQGG